LSAKRKYCGSREGIEENHADAERYQLDAENFEERSRPIKRGRPVKRVEIAVRNVPILDTLRAMYTYPFIERIDSCQPNRSEVNGGKEKE